MTTGRRIRFGRIATALVVSLALVATACGGDGSSGGNGAGGEANADADPAEVADRDGEFVFAHTFGHSSFDPHRSPNASGDSAWMRPVYDRLLTLAEDEDGSVEVAPQLATSYEVAEDGLSVEFELRDDVTFHDGEPFNADAVVANIERAKDPESTVSSLLEPVETVEAVDDTHVVFHLSRPYPGLIYSLAADTIGMMISPAAFDTDLATHPVGAGPFTLVSAQRDGDVVYERWEDHWDEDAALVSRLTITTVSDANARLNGVRTGEYDAGYMSNPLDLQSRELEDEGFHWVNELAPITIGVLFNTNEPPFDDVDVRRAVSMALNRSEISEELLGGIAPPVYQPFPEGYLGFDPDIDEDPYDPEAARDLIEQAGADGTSVRLLTMTTPPYDSIAQIAQQALGDIGLEVEIEPVSPTVGIPTWMEGGHAAYIGTILAEPEPSLTLGRSYLGSHNLGEPPAELVEMAEEADALPLGSDEREAAYQEISAFLQENPIHLPLIQFSTVVLARPEVVGAEHMVKVVIGKLDFRGVGVTES
ncbi:MAG TPA: ABC transporter substrate-binding protein [Acidimicrobiales bacterium]